MGEAGRQPTLEPQEETQPSQHFDFSLGSPGRDFWPQNCRIIILCCFKPLFVVIGYSSHRKRTWKLSKYLEKEFQAGKAGGTEALR